MDLTLVSGRDLQYAIRRRYLRVLASGVCLLALALCAAPLAADDTVDFNRDIRPILSNQCFACHGPDAKERKGGTDGYRLDNEQGAFADLGGYTTIVRGKPEESELIRRITSGDADERMPPVDSGKKLTARDIQLLTQWVKQGAPYAKHWAYVKPVRPPLPDNQQTVAEVVRLRENKQTVAEVVRLRENNPGHANIAANVETLPSWPRNEIDYFILDRLLREALVPSPEADRYALVRRVSLDLTGLPPTLDEVDQFVNDTSADAYEKLVDRLLEKKSYGEHWARTWLDLARYADSAGYADDPARTIWAYRDYVIDSLNANKPFDQFTIEQIAGDLLPAPTEEQLTATAFNRNTLTNNEGGTNDEEFRNVAIVDRVNTTLAVWMGTTMMCAQCHDHKYDPLSQEEYFRLFAIFNNTDDADRRDESPLLSFFTEEQQEQKAQLEAEIAELERPQQSAAADAPSAKDRLAALKKQLAEVKPHTTVPVMRELPEGKRRKTQIQLRGNFLDLGREVTEGLPREFHPLPEGTPVNRLALAKWLVDENNPLTARVIVNRYWEQIFGVGIVRTSEEFGTQGELPLHPELLDWLATELVQQHWDMKHVLKLLVRSAAYRQSSRVTPELMERDPENRLLARGPRFRLSAEMIRDQALSVSGLLSAKLHGPPVKPPQPSLGISAAFGSGIDWQASEGEDRYRRGLYTTWRRSNPYPSMATFDAPNREVCTLHRDRTNTPLQALVTLNDPVYVEAAQALARRMTAAGSSPSERASYGFRLCLARPPTPDELDRLVRLHEQARERFANDADKAKRIATVPLGAAPPDSDLTDLAAWMVVSNVLLNLDEMMMKR